MGSRDKILFIDDDPLVCKLVQDVLERDGFEVIVAPDGRTGMEEARRRRPSLVLLDMTLPDMSGIDICAELKQEPATKGTPVIFVTGKTEKVDVVVGLGVGADDYVTKPFDVTELKARIRAVLRRSRAAASGSTKAQIALGSITLDSGRMEAIVAGSKIAFSVAEFRILWALAEAAGVILTRDQILDRMNHGNAVVSDRTIDVHINSIRKKLGPFAKCVETIRGVGYRLREE